MEASERARVTGGISMDFTARDDTMELSETPFKVPRKLRERLLKECKTPCTLEEIDSKLRNADLRRQEFFEEVLSKARVKPRSLSCLESHEKNLRQRFEEKLQAAAQNRLSILAGTQKRLARLDELRQAARTAVELRFEKEHWKLSSKVESRAQQAEANRQLIFKAYLQRKGTLKERSFQSILRRVALENKCKERVHNGIQQKRLVAEKIELRLLDVEKSRARARVPYLGILHQREVNNRRLRDEFEDRLQRAKRQRAEYLRKSYNEPDMTVTTKELPCETEVIVNEYLHDELFAVKDKRSLKAKIREKAFWDGIIESFEKDEVNYDQIVQLMRGVRDETCKMAPKNWKEDIYEAIDPDASQAPKTEISTARLKMFVPFLNEIPIFKYLREAFSSCYGSPSFACTSMPMTLEWFKSSFAIHNQEWIEHLNIFSHLSTRTGGHFPAKTTTNACDMLFSSQQNKGYQLRECDGEIVNLLVRLGLLKLLSKIGCLQKDNLPETLKINLKRLIMVQEHILKNIVTSTSILVCRETLLSERVILTQREMESILLKCTTQLLNHLDEVVEINIAGTVDMISNFATDYDNVINTCKIERRKSIMATVLVKSLQAENIVFEKVSRAVYLATRGVLLGGNGPAGRKLADIALRRVGAVAITERVIEAAKMLSSVAEFSIAVYEPWYRNITESL